MMNMMNMVKQAQNIQKKLATAQEELAKMDIEAETAGSVKIICDGKGMFKSIKLEKSAINAENPESVSDETIETLEDLISTAMFSAMKKSKTIMDEKMKSITGGVNIPGLM